MIVKSTITQIDLLEKQRKLNAEIVRLKQEKENAERNFKSIEASLEEIINKKKNLEDSINGLVEVSGLLLDEINDKIVKYKSIAFDWIKFLDNIKEEVKKSEKRIDEKAKEFEVFQEKIKIETKRIGEESAKLTLWKSDLDIYKKRIEKVISENNLKINIILP